MTPTDLELREKVALEHGWFNIKSRTDPTRWYLANGEAQELPPLSHWAWPCLLELVKAGKTLCTNSYEDKFGIWDKDSCGKLSPFVDPDPARAVVLAWLKFKESNRSAERAGR